ncbi:hypothetical protein Q670_02085 [Alcanivorax sp. P2S70]|nr:hypothetical protein [Alcanivorax sp. P2S70]ERP90395.1 hypothetical protein Q670_02085 [Alcanivorax sp. P2S70]|tara:strand:+ start:746 stop:874 length:129 start_codon:yes stop_codon:yes gene_type:complete
MRTLILVLGLAISAIATADARAPTEEEMQQLETVQPSWIFQG